MSRKKPAAPVTTITDATVNPTPRKRGRPAATKPAPQPASEPPKVEETKPWHADTHLSPEDKAKWEIRKHEFTGVSIKPGMKPIFEALLESKALSLIGTPVPEGYKLGSTRNTGTFLTVRLIHREEEPLAGKVTQSPYEVPSRQRRSCMHGMMGPMYMMAMEDIMGLKPDIHFDIPLKDINLSILGLNSDLINVVDVRIVRYFCSSDREKFFALVGGNKALTLVALREGLFDCVSAISRGLVTLADLEELTAPSKFFVKFKEYYKL